MKFTYTFPLLFFLICVPASVLAKNLYTCVKDDQVTMQDHEPKDCDELTIMPVPKYKSSNIDNKDDKAMREMGLGLRPLERAQLQLLDSPISSQYNTDIADALFQREQDARNDKCIFFKARVEEAVDDLKFQPGIRNVGILERQIERDKRQVKYYCSKQ